VRVLLHVVCCLLRRSQGIFHSDGSEAHLSVGDTIRNSALPEQLLSQGESSLQRNLEVQEMTLKVQMELQEELSRQLQLQKKLQGEMEALMSAHVEVRDESTATNSKMSSILALKRKLQVELQAHLRMQHQLLSQLNQVVLPAVERLHTEREKCESADSESGLRPNKFKANAKFVVLAANSCSDHAPDGGGLVGDGGAEGEVDDDDDDDDDDDADDDADLASNKRRKIHSPS